MESAVLYKKRRNGAQPFMHLGFDDYAPSPAVKIGSEFEPFCLQGKHLQKSGDSLLGLSRAVDSDRGPSPYFGKKILFRKLPVDIFCIEIWLVAFVDGDKDRRGGCFCLLNGFECLRTHPLVAWDDQNNNIRHIRPARAHLGKGFVARSIQDGEISV